MLGERIDSRPLLRLVTVSKGAWLRPDIPTPEGPPARLPAPYWASAARRGGLRRSSVRVTLREAYRRRVRRAEAYQPAAVINTPLAPHTRRLVAEPAPRAESALPRAPLFRLAADLFSQVFKPEA